MGDEARSSAAKLPGHRARGPLGALRGLSTTERAGPEGLSCGIAYLPQGGSRLTLARYNGSSHVHGGIAYHPHIHRATALAIAAGRKPESEAEETNLYTTLDGAFRCLILDYPCLNHRR